MIYVWTRNDQWHLINFTTRDWDKTANVKKFTEPDTLATLATVHVINIQSIVKYRQPVELFIGKFYFTTPNNFSSLLGNI